MTDMKHTLISPEQVARLRQAAAAIQRFAEESDRAQHFDTGDALNLMGEAHDAIEWIFTPTKDQPDAYDIVAAANCAAKFAIIVEPVIWNDDPDGEITYTFTTEPELRAFHYGMREGAKLGHWEVTYTDEENK